MGGLLVPRLLRLLTLTALATLLATAGASPIAAAAQASADLGLVNLSDSPDPATTGDTVTYWVGIQNSGPDAATGVRLEIQFPAGLRFDPTRSDAACTLSGSTVTCAYESWPADATGMVPISATAVSAGTHEVAFTITANERDRHPANNTATQTTTVVQPTEADVSIQLGDAQVREGEFFYGFTVSNAGPAAATNTVATLQLPAGIEYVSGGCTVSGSTLTCSAGTSIPSGAGVGAILQLRASAPGSYTITGTVTANEPDPNTANNADTGTIVVAPADADLAIDLPESTMASAGETFSYPVTVTNSGPADATNVVATVQLASGVAYMGGDCSANGAIVTCGFGSVAAGSSETATLQLSAANAATYTINAAVDGQEPDPVSGNDADSGTVTVDPVADVSVAIADSTDPVKPGQGVTYTITVANAGPSAATAVTLNGTWSTTSARGVAVVATASTQGTCSATDSGLDCELGTLSAGASATVSVTLRPRGTGLLTLSATAQATEFDGDAGDNTASESTTVGPR
jgi:uncharacterized repeat protein (TIGR01451 family)